MTEVGWIATFLCIETFVVEKILRNRICNKSKNQYNFRSRRFYNKFIFLCNILKEAQFKKIIALFNFKTLHLFISVPKKGKTQPDDGLQPNSSLRRLT